MLEEEKERIARFKAMTEEEINAEQVRWLEKAEAVHEIFLERNRKAMREWEDGLEDRVAVVKAAHEKAESEATGKVKTAEQERDQLKNELAGIKGLFTGKKKAVLQEAINKKEEEIAALQKKCAELPALLEENLKKAQEEGRPKEVTDKTKIPEDMLVEFWLEPSPGWLCKRNEDYVLPDYIWDLRMERVYSYHLLYRIIEGYGRIRKKEYETVLREQINSFVKASDIKARPLELIGIGNLQRLSKALRNPVLIDMEKVSLDESDYDSRNGNHWKSRHFYYVGS